jgi:hypothetical protein
MGRLHNPQPGTSGPSNSRGAGAFNRFPMGVPPVDVDVEHAMMSGQAEVHRVSKSTLNSTLRRREGELEAMQSHRDFMNPGIMEGTDLSMELSPIRRIRE